jgi:mycothiol synthase
MTDLQNRAFTGSWGFAPNVPQEVAYRLGMGGGRPEDTLILELESVPLAYCWTQMQTLDGQPTGIIWMIGAVPEARGKGLGREMLLASLDYLLGRGAKAIELTVYQDNTPAVELYKATGFKPTGEIVFYEKKL